MQCLILPLNDDDQSPKCVTAMRRYISPALEQIVHLRTPKDTTVGKVKESCLKMLGMTEEKDTFTLKDNQGLNVHILTTTPETVVYQSPESPVFYCTGLSAELATNQQIGNLLTSSTTLLELHLCKKVHLLLLL